MKIAFHNKEDKGKFSYELLTSTRHEVVPASKNEEWPNIFISKKDLLRITLTESEE